MQWLAYMLLVEMLLDTVPELIGCHRIDGCQPVFASECCVPKMGYWFEKWIVRSLLPSPTAMAGYAIGHYAFGRFDSRLDWLCHRSLCIW